MVCGVACIAVDVAACACCSAAWVVELVAIVLVSAAAVAAVDLCSSMRMLEERVCLACDVPGRTGAVGNELRLRFTGCPESADLDLERVIIQHLVTVMRVQFHQWVTVRKATFRGGERNHRVTSSIQSI